MDAILLLEDDDRLVDHWREALTAKGFECLHARTLAEAEAIVQMRKVGAAVVDIFLERGDSETVPDGLAFLMRLNTLSFGSAKVPTVVVTGHDVDSYDTMSLAERLRADRVMRKPVDPAQLTEAIGSLTSAASNLAGARRNAGLP